MNASRLPVVVALSGGVDSSVAAALLLRQGLDVIAVTLQLRPCGEGVEAGSCCGSRAIETARAVADRLGIPHEVLPVGTEFRDRVLRPAWDLYRQGRTPNPCLACNREIKFGVLWQYAAMLGASQVATGHYAMLEPAGDGDFALFRGRDRSKDQSYFLYDLPREVRGRVRFPLGSMTKAEVRALARDLGLASADRPESQDACLVAEGSFAEALRRAVDGEARPGVLVDREGREIGRHQGLHRFTVGQRQGIGVALGRRAFVRSLDPATGTVEVTTEEGDLRAGGAEVEAVRWWGPVPAGDFRCQVQVRYRSREAPALVTPQGTDRLMVRFDEPVRAVAPGQAAVLYAGDRVLAGGLITVAMPGPGG